MKLISAARPPIKPIKPTEPSKEYINNTVELRSFDHDKYTDVRLSELFHEYERVSGGRSVQEFLDDTSITVSLSCTDIDCNLLGGEKPKEVYEKQYKEYLEFFKKYKIALKEYNEQMAAHQNYLRHKVKKQKIEQFNKLKKELEESGDI